MELAALAPLLAAVGAEMPRARQMGSKLKAFVLLAQYRDSHSNPAQVDQVVSRLAAELMSLVSGIQERLKPFPYPFPHARGPLTAAEYARYEKPEAHEWLRAFRDANAHVERLFALNHRLIGRILACAEAAEKRTEDRGE